MAGRKAPRVGGSGAGPNGLLPVAVLAFGLVAAVRGGRLLRQTHYGSATDLCGTVGTKLDGGQVRSRLAYVREGRERQFWNHSTSTTLTDPAGREVEVLVRPENPGDAVVSASLAGGTAVGLEVAP